MREESFLRKYLEYTLYLFAKKYWASFQEAHIERKEAYEEIDVSANI
jgi:hypothetical protein